MSPRGPLKRQATGDARKFMRSNENPRCLSEQQQCKLLRNKPHKQLGGPKTLQNKPHHKKTTVWSFPINLILTQNLNAI